MANQVVWNQMNIHMDGETITLKRGDMVPDELQDKDPHQYGTLMIIGAVRPVEVVETPAKSVQPVNRAPDLSSDSDGITKPSSSDNRDVWVAYAKAKGMDPAKADGMTKPKLMEEYKDQ